MSQGDAVIVRTLTLSKPIHWAGETINELTFKDPEAELLDILERTRASKKPQSESMALLQWFTGVGVVSLKRLAWKDMARACRIADELMADDEEDPATGED